MIYKYNPKITNILFGILLLQYSLISINPPLFTHNIKLKKNDKCMVIGCGISGLTTAYYLLQKHPNMNITIVDKNKDIAQGTSYGPASEMLWNKIKKGGKYKFTYESFSQMVSIMKAYIYNLFSKEQSIDEINGYLQKCYKLYKRAIDDLKLDKKYHHDTGCLYLFENKNKFNFNKNLYKNNNNLVFYTKSEYKSSPYYNKLFDSIDVCGYVFDKQSGYVDAQNFCIDFYKKLKIKFGNRLKLILNTEVTKINSQNKYDLVVLCCGIQNKEMLKNNNIKGGETLVGMKGYTLTGRLKNKIKTDIKYAFCYVTKNGPYFGRKFIDKHYALRIGGMASGYNPNDKNKINNKLVDKYMLTIIKKFSYAKTDKINYDNYIDDDKIELWSGVREFDYRNIYSGCTLYTSNPRVLVSGGLGSNGYVYCWKTGSDLADMIKTK